jgi:hypothetical protein
MGPEGRWGGSADCGEWRDDGDAPSDKYGSRIADREHAAQISSMRGLEVQFIPRRCVFPKPD